MGNRWRTQTEIMMFTIKFIGNDTSISALHPKLEVSVTKGSESLVGVSTDNEEMMINRSRRW